MAACYSEGTKYVPYFSNPDVDIDGVATGTADANCASLFKDNMVGGC